MKKLVVLIGACAFAACMPISRIKQDSGKPTLVSEFGVQTPASAAKRDKLPTAEASAPSRALDMSDPTGGRLSLVEMHRMAMRDNESLKSEMRAREQQIAEIESAREAFRARAAELETETKKMQKGFEEMSKENLDLKSQLLEAAIRVAELEKQLLQTKIDALKTRKPAAKPAEKKPEAHPETPEPAHSEPEKKEKGH